MSLKTATDNYGNGERETAPFFVVTEIVNNLEDRNYMNIKKFTISGFAKFYRSLLKYGRDKDRSCASELTYNLYVSVNDVYLHKNPNACITKYGETDFCDMLQKTGIKPYKTVMQFYRALEALYRAIDEETDALITFDQLRALFTVSSMMDDIESRFRKAFNVKIYDESTVYAICAESLVPRRDEPGVCLMRDLAAAQSRKSEEQSNILVDIAGKCPYNKYSYGIWNITAKRSDINWLTATSYGKRQNANAA